MEEISYKDSLKIKDRLYIDVRSPGEFSHDSLPGSVNIPLFSNSERSEIGKIYKALGKETAIVKGTEFVGEKLGGIVNTILGYREKDLIITCARGGMRSGSVVSLLASLGIKAMKLRNGYRGYRNYIRERFESLEIRAPLFVLHGLTGTGKTEVIRNMEYTLDLEEMAGHRSSIFGGIGLQQKTQKKFESSIIRKIDELEDAPYILLEGESKKIGNLHIPPGLFQYMNNARSILLTANIEQRIEIILNEYSEGLNKDEVKTIVKSLRSKLGPPMIDELIELLDNNNLKDFTRIMFNEYYDPLYQHKLKRRKYLAEIKFTDIRSTIEQIRRCLENHIHTNE
jgi:tRNA 2-selenouridine synthase